MEVPARELISAELETMHRLANELLSQNKVKVFGFVEIQNQDDEIYSITDLDYEGKIYHMILIEEGQEESGVSIRSTLVNDLEIMLPLPMTIRMTNKEEAIYDDLC
jgi:hypothetical protein